jgi:hypothetical protein
MRRVQLAALAAAASLMFVAPAQGQDQAIAVEGGGIHIAGWQGRIDAGETRAGQVLNNARLAQQGDALHVKTGPAVAYWNPANTVSGDYTVRATFREPAYMSLNNHPHPYGIFIGGNDMGTDAQTYLYCAAYGSGTFIVRGFGPAPFSVSERRPTANDAVNKAAGQGQPVTQEIAVTVRGGKIDCAINGTVVGSYDVAAATGEGKLKSTNGIYGIRFAHNTEGFVTGLAVTKH